MAANFTKNIDVLLANAPSVLLTVLAAAIASVLMFIVGLNLPPVHRKSTQSGSWALQTGCGVAIALLTWTVSLFVFKTTVPGTLGIGLLIVRGCFRYRTEPSRSGRLPIAGIVIAIVLAVWHIGVQWQPYDGDIIVVDRFGDLGVHTNYATRVSECGLPMINTNGLKPYQYESLCHTGFQTLIAGIADTTGGNFPAAVQILWIIGYGLIVVSAFHLVESSLPNVSSYAMSLASLAPLLWTGIWIVPVVAISRHPIALLDPMLTGQCAAGGIYHNGSQLWSIALTVVGLVALKRAGDSGHSRLNLAIAMILFVTSGLVKPSLFILIIPALIIVLAASRYQDPVGWITVFSISCAGILVYSLPIFFGPLPTMPGWQLSATPGNTVQTALRFLTFSSVATWIATRLLRSLPQHSLWFGVVLIAHGGGILFPLLFQESGVRAAHGNNWWGFMATLVLLAPPVVAFCFSGDRINKGALRRMGAVVIVSQVILGIPYAIAYPAISIRSRPIELANALLEAKALTNSTDRMIIDPVFCPEPHHADLIVFLGRSVLHSYQTNNADVETAKSEWTQLHTTGRSPDDATINDWNTALVSTENANVKSWLRRNGWRHKAAVTGGYEIWKNARN